MQADLNNNINREPEPIFTPATKPIMVYDGACSFCRFWVSKWQHDTKVAVNYIPFQELPDTYCGVSREQFKKAVYLITQYRRLHGAAAVFEVLALGGNSFWIRLYNNVVFAAPVFEAGYSIVANNREFFFWLTKLFYKEARQPDIQHPSSY